jgi:hypothetical protein
MAASLILGASASDFGTYPCNEECSTRAARQVDQEGWSPGRGPALAKLWIALTVGLLRQRGWVGP